MAYHILWISRWGQKAVSGRIGAQRRAGSRKRIRPFSPPIDETERGVIAIMAHSYILARVNIQPSGCWVWNLRPNKDGYGSAVLDGRLQLAHRLSYATFIGPLVPGLVIHHQCYNTMCVNPEHLEQITGEENLQRGSGRVVPSPEAAPTGHGTIAAYQRGKCRCNYCREANRVYMRQRRERLGLTSRPAKGGYAKVRGRASRG